MYIKVLLVIISTIFLFSNSFAQEQTRNTLIYPEGKPLTLNPLDITDDVAFRLCPLIFNRLVSVTTAGGKIIPDLLESVSPQEKSFPAQTVTFKLRQNVRWDDGQPVTANDVKFTFDMIKHNETETNLKWIRSVISEVQAIDKYTVRFNLNESMGLIPLLEKIGYIYIIPKHRFSPGTRFISAENNFGFGREWICGTGPYYGIENFWDKGGGKITLRRNRNYHKGFQPVSLKPNQYRIEKIETEKMGTPNTAKQALFLAEKGKSGTIDLIPVTRPIDWPEFRNGTNTTLLLYNIRSCLFVAFNCRDNILSDRRIRKALTLVVDRWQILSSIYGETNVNKIDLMTGPYFPEEVRRHQPLGYENYNYRSEENIRKAKQLLKEAGYPDGFTVELKGYMPDEESRSIVEAIEGCLEQIGVRLTKPSMERDTWWQEVVVQKNFQMAFGQWTFHTHTDIVETLFLESSPLNIGGYNKKRVEDLIKELKGNYNDEEIMTIKDEIQRIIREDCPYLWLFRVPLAAAYRNDLHIDIHPYWFFGFVNNWYREER